MTRIPNFKKPTTVQWFVFRYFLLPIAGMLDFLSKLKKRVLIIALVCLSSAFIFSGQVNASADDEPFGAGYGEGNGQGTITTGTNQILVCTVSGAGDYPVPSWNGDQFTFLAGTYNTHSNNTHNAYYLLNPDTGTHTLSWTGSVGGGISCRVFEDVDLLDPIVASSTVQSNFNETYNTVQEINDVQVVIAGFFSSPFGSADPAWLDGYSAVDYWGDNHANVLNAFTSGDNYSVLFNTSNGGGYFFIELRSILPQPIIEVFSPADGETITDGNVGVYADFSNFNVASISARLHDTGSYNEIYVSSWQATSTATTTVILTPFFYGGYYDLYFTAYNENGITEVLQNFTVPQPECTSWIYSDWSACIYGSKTRTILSSNPTGCAGGTPEIWQSCSDSNPYAYWQTNITMNNPYTCVPGFDCPIRYNYNQSFYDDGDYIEVFNASDVSVSTSTIIDLQFLDKQNGKSIFYIDTAGMSTTTYFNVVGYHDGASSSPVSLTLNFAAYADNQGEFMPGIATSTEDICEGLDMTVNAFGFPNSFGDTLTCGFKVAMHWAFYPDQKYINLLGETYKEFQETAPFSVFYQITNALTSGVNSQTLTTNDTFGVPMIRDNGTSTEYYIVPVVSSSSMSSAIGSDNALLVRNTISWILWIMIALGFSILIFYKKT